MVWLAILLGIGLLLAPASIALYRHMAGLRMDARSALAHIEEQMHRRHALLSRLVESSPQDEANLTEASQAGVEAGNVQEKAAAERAVRSHLSASLNRLEGLEKAFLDDLERTRLKIDFAATFYNDVVHRYNLKLRRGPGRWLGKLTGHQPHDPFDIDDPAEHGSH